MPKRKSNFTMYVVIVVLIAVIFFSSFRPSGQGITITWSNLFRTTTFGVIIYHESMFNYPKPSLEEKEVIVSRCKEVGNRINIYTQPDGWTAWDLGSTVLAFTNIAKSQGVRVTWTLRDEGNPDSDWSLLGNETMEIAEIAQANGVAELIIGCENGFRLSSFSQSENVDAVLNLIQEVKTVFYGSVSYTMSWWAELDAWTTYKNDPRLPQTIFLDIYENIETFKSRIDVAVTAFGSRLRIGEFGVQMGRNATTFESGDFQERVDYIKSKNIAEAWCFCYRELSDGGFGLWTVTTDAPKESWNILVAS